MRGVRGLFKQQILRRDWAACDSLSILTKYLYGPIFYNHLWWSNCNHSLVQATRIHLFITFSPHVFGVLTSPLLPLVAFFRCIRQVVQCWSLGTSCQLQMPSPDIPAVVPKLSKKWCSWVFWMLLTSSWNRYVLYYIRSHAISFQRIY